MKIKLKTVLIRATVGRQNSFSASWQKKVFCLNRLVVFVRSIIAVFPHVTNVTPECIDSM